jgi:hypothetical protein
VIAALYVDPTGCYSQVPAKERIMEVRKGQIVTLKPEYLEPGEENVPHVAIEDSFNGVVRVEPQHSTLRIKPINDWRTSWIATAE